MKLKRYLPLAVALVVSSAAYIPMQASAQSFSIVIGNAPPPVRYEFVPPPRRGYIWVPGYWNWNGRRHVWAEGHWERARRGYVYSAPRWEQRHDGWHLARGHWRRGDRDGDGVPNRADRDRDGDGVRNNRDSRPNDPRRY